MGSVGDGISRVKVWLLAAGVSEGGKTVNEPLCAVVGWRSDHNDKLHQIYVNGTPAAISSNFQQRRVVVAIPYCSDTGVRIEISAVEPAVADIDFLPGMLPQYTQTGRARIDLLRSQSFPYCGKAEIYSDGATGQVDYEIPISAEPIRLWPAWQDKIGFGLGRFACGDFGYEGGGAIGFGRGAFGLGQFGFDEDMIIWQTAQLQTGRWLFGVQIKNRAGNNYGQPVETGQVTIIRTAQPAVGLETVSYDQQHGELVLDVLQDSAD